MSASTSSRGRIQVEAGPRAGGYAQAFMQRLCAMMSGPHSNAIAIQDLGHIVRVDVIEGE